MVLLRAWLGDITTLEVDIVVNAANSTLLGGGGVDGAIHRAAGPELLELCKTMSGCEVGAAKITPGFKLPARYIAHVVGPTWQGGHVGEARLLESCYQSALTLAGEYGCPKIAFPCVSTGAYRFPADAAAKIAIATVERHCDKFPLPTEVLFCCYDQQSYQRYQQLLAEDWGKSKVK